jgi:hypothetical protein
MPDYPSPKVMDALHEYYDKIIAFGLPEEETLAMMEELTRRTFRPTA